MTDDTQQSGGSAGKKPELTQEQIDAAKLAEKQDAIAAAAQEQNSGAAGGVRAREPLVLPQIFDRMQRYQLQKHVRAVKIAAATPVDGDKTELTFEGGYFPPVHADVHVPEAREGEKLNHYLMIEEDGRHHVVDAAEFEQHFKPV